MVFDRSKKRCLTKYHDKLGRYQVRRVVVTMPAPCYGYVTSAHFPDDEFVT